MVFFYENGGLDLFGFMVWTIRCQAELGYYGRTTSGKTFDARGGVTIDKLRRVVERLNKDAVKNVTIIQGLNDKIFRLRKYFTRASFYRNAADPRLFGLVGPDEGDSAYKVDAVVEKLEDFLDFIQG